MSPAWHAAQAASGWIHRKGEMHILPEGDTDIAFTYDSLSRVTLRVAGSDTTVWKYDPTQQWTAVVAMSSGVNRQSNEA